MTEWAGAGKEMSKMWQIHSSCILTRAQLGHHAYASLSLPSFFLASSSISRCFYPCKTSLASVRSFSTWCLFCLLLRFDCLHFFLSVCLSVRVVLMRRDADNEREEDRKRNGQKEGGKEWKNESQRETGREFSSSLSSFVPSALFLFSSLPPLLAVMWSEPAETKLSCSL